MCPETVVSSFLIQFIQTRDSQAYASHHWNPSPSPLPLSTLITPPISQTHVACHGTESQKKKKHGRLKMLQPDASPPAPSNPPCNPSEPSCIQFGNDRPKFVPYPTSFNSWHLCDDQNAAGKRKKITINLQDAPSLESHFIVHSSSSQSKQHYF